MVVGCIGESAHQKVRSSPESLVARSAGGSDMGVAYAKREARSNGRQTGEPYGPWAPSTVHSLAAPADTAIHTAEPSIEEDEARTARGATP